MKFTINNDNKAKQFICIFKHLKDLVETCTLIFNKGGLYLQSMDSTHICLCELNLENTWFDNYEYKSESDNESATIHCQTFHDVISCYKDNNTIIVLFDSKKNNLNITFTGDKCVLKEFTLLTLDGEDDLMEIPDAEYTADVCLKSGELAELVNELSIFSNDLKFNCDDEWLRMTAKGDNGQMRVNISDENILHYQIVEEETIELTYSLEYLKRVCSFNKVNDLVDVHINKELPLKIVYDFDIPEKSKDDEESAHFENKKKNYIKFYVAPKLEDDEF
tara:strand:+ start:3182 stop:4012 length:831 start_codon:yes stop_codon:yes gene_type:complete